MTALKRGLTHAEALAYLGVKRRTFDTLWRPRLVEISAGTCSIFDRVDLDRLFDDFKRQAEEAQNAARNGRPANEKGTGTWAVKQRGSIPKTTDSGKSTNIGEVLDFDSVASAVLKRQKAG